MLLFCENSSLISAKSSFDVLQDFDIQTRFPLHLLYSQRSPFYNFCELTFFVQLRLYLLLSLSSFDSDCTVPCRPTSLNPTMTVFSDYSRRHCCIFCHNKFITQVTLQLIYVFCYNSLFYYVTEVLNYVDPQLIHTIQVSSI